MSEKLPERVERLLRSAIESVERLDVLLHLRADPHHAFSARAVATALHLPTHAVEHDLAALCGRGILKVNIASALLYTYNPVSETLDGTVRELEELTRRRREDVVAILRAR